MIATLLNKKIYTLNGQLIQKPSDIISPLTNLKEGEIIFIDEIHALSKEVIEILYPVLEDGKLNIIMGKDYNSKIVKVKIPNFTLIGATTDLNKLPNPFIDRFSINFLFTNYTEKEIAEIILINCEKKFINLDFKKCLYIAKNSKNNPRLALNNLERINDYIIFENPNEISGDYLRKTLNKIGVYKYGLTKLDLQYLNLILNNKGPMGLDSIKQLLDTSISTIKNNIEPNLISNKLIFKSAKGRCITPKGILFLDENKNKIW